MNPPFAIDLIICTYNNAALLRRTLEGLEGLIVPSHIRWSVLVVNNNYSDNTAAVVNGFVKKGSIPLFTVTETEQGLTPARRRGVRESSAGWIAFVDDDCVLAPDWLQEAEHFANTHPECKLFGGKINLVWEKEPPAYVHFFPFAYAAKNHGNTAKPVHSVAGAGMVANRKALFDCGWATDPLLPDRLGKKLVSGGDVEIALRIGALFPVWYHPGCRLQHIIPQRRTTKEYLQRMVFGLGISRHHSTALKWKRHYASWLFYSIAYTAGLFWICLYDVLLSKRKAAGAGVVFSTFYGWCAGIRDLWQMPKEKRRKLLGCAVNKTPVQPAFTNSLPRESVAPNL